MTNDTTEPTEAEATEADTTEAEAAEVEEVEGPAPLPHLDAEIEFNASQA
jgi:hypothetical protein